ncbi:MAG: RloB family protein, partial [Salibacteraceae bacterium]
MAGRKFKRLGKGRKRHGRKILKYFLIVCEGQKTEPHYFKGLKRQLSKGVLRQIEIDIRGIGANTQSLVKKALEIKSEIEFDTTRPIDQVWVVFDRDSFKKQQFNQAVAFCE